MLISRTPLRITFVGGGTDLPEYYKKAGVGVSIAAAINKYVYISVHKRFDNNIRVSYSKTELVDSVDKIEHPAVRETLKLLKVDGGLEIYHMADIPAGGTGLGSGSCFVVGLLKALHAWKEETISPAELAEEAIMIEREMLKEHAGKQDQYIAAFGGLRFMEFRKDGSVSAKSIELNRESMKNLQNHLLLLYTGVERRADGILSKQAIEVDDHIQEYNKMVEFGYSMFKDLSDNKWTNAGKYLHENWLLKKTLSKGISNSVLDDYYNRAIDAGAQGGKVLGAGGGGFLMIFADPSKHEKIVKALPELRPVPFEFSQEGTKIIYDEV